MHQPLLRSVILIAFTLPALFSCNNSKNEDLILILNNNIVQSNNIINGQTIDLLHSLEAKLKDPVTTEKAGIWYPKAEYIHNISIELINILKSAKTKGFNADSITEKVAEYPNKILKTDPKINEAFKDSFGKLFIESSHIKKVLADSDSISVTALLNGLENSVRIAEAKALAFCNDQQSAIIEYHVTSAIIVQNSSVVEKGMPIEITAGIGEFSTKNQAVVKINNKHVPLSENGAAIYELKSPQKAGKYNVPVEIEYIDQDGKKLNLTKTITYTVVE